MFWSKLKRQKHDIDTTTVGIAIINGEAAAIACDGEFEGRPNAIAWDLFPANTPAELQLGLQNFVEANGLQNWTCRCVLSPEDYSLRLVERPANVPDDELVDATRWLVRDLIEFDVEEAALTILLIPENNARARTPRMFVVAARHESVRDFANAIQSAGLEVKGFDIIESAMLALEARMPDVVAGSASLRINDKSSVLTLSLDDHLYLARNLNIDSESLESAALIALDDASPSNPQVVELLDPLLLDIQRSLDYYESEYGQATPSRLALLPSQIDLTPLTPALAEAIRPVQVEIYELPHYFHFEDIPRFGSSPTLAVAAGAAISGPRVIHDELLPASFRRSAGGLGLAAVLQLAAATTLLLCAYCVVSWVALRNERDALVALETEHAEISVQAETIRADAAARSLSLNPQAEINQLRSERDVRISMLRDLGSQSTRSDASFSKLLLGLARQDIDGVWLERIEFSKGGDAIAIEGRSLKAEYVPKFLRRLGAEPSFQKRGFRTFEMSRESSEATGLGFRIATLGLEATANGGGQ